jgi:hypothetical protein
MQYATRCGGLCAQAFLRSKHCFRMIHVMLQQDKRMLQQSGTLSHRQRMCAQLRLAERKALQHTVDYFRMDSSALERKEYYQVCTRMCIPTHVRERCEPHCQCSSTAMSDKETSVQGARDLVSIMFALLL